MKRIPIAGPWITQQEISAVTYTVKTEWYERCTRSLDAFSEAFAKYIGVAHAIPVSHGTMAIHLALAALGIGPGDEVIVPDITWIATAAPIVHLGATPVFADIEPDTWCISVDNLESLITPKTKAVIPVDLYGGMPDYGRIWEIAHEYNIQIIEDAAQGLGAMWGLDTRAGSAGLFGCFSFHGTKLLTTGEGGMVVTDDDGLAAYIDMLRNHGQKPRLLEERKFYNYDVTDKSAMSNVQAALGLAQLQRIDELVDKKRQIFTWYLERLGLCEHITLNTEMLDTSNVYWMTTAIIDKSLKLPKEKLMALLDEQGIDTRPFFYPLSSLPAFKRYPTAREARGRNKAAYDISPWGINLPSALCLDEEDVDYVCDKLLEIIKG